MTHQDFEIIIFNEAKFRSACFFLFLEILENEQQAVKFVPGRLDNLDVLTCLLIQRESPNESVKSIISLIERINEITDSFCAAELYREVLELSEKSIAQKSKTFSGNGTQDSAAPQNIPSSCENN